MQREERHCLGCGVALQNKDENVIGYIPQDHTEDGICRRCFRIRHYGQVSVVDQSEEDYLQVLEKIAKTHCLVVQVVDLFDLPGSLIPHMPRYVGENPLLVLANKVDLFPSSTKWGRLKNKVFMYLQANGLKPLDVVLCSGSRRYGLDQAVLSIECARKGHDVYVVGAANVGKSTLMNHLLQAMGQDSMMTTSPYPGTTLHPIPIPISGKSYTMVDTPGYLHSGRLSLWLSPAELKEVLPKKPIHPRLYQLHDRQTLFLGGLARLDYVRGEKQTFACYVSNSLYIHRTKQQEADAFWRKHQGELLVPPQAPSALPPWQEHQLELLGKKEDIVISGLGWITVGKKKGTLSIFAPSGVQVSRRPAWIGSMSEDR